MKKKTAYRTRNWSEYNRSLKQRGSLTVWIGKDALANWTTSELTGEPRASPIYTDLAIETMATVQAIYTLPGRQTQGFLESIFEPMKIDLPVPDHSARSRRRKSLSITLEDVPGTIEQVSADGAYDQRKCYDELNRHGARAAIPPHKGAHLAIRQQQNRTSPA